MEIDTLLQQIDLGEDRDYEFKSVVIIHVPRATRTQRPVYFTPTKLRILPTVTRNRPASKIEG